MSKQKWDLTSVNSLNGALGWLRKNSGAWVVLAIRPNDVSISISDDLHPLEVVTMVRNELPSLLQILIDRRAADAAKSKPKRNRAAEPAENLDADPV